MSPAVDDAHVPAARPPSLTERTIEAVREGIRNGSFVPGELYSVYRLADELGVSRSPVRDALLRLAETGMVAFERNRGFRVVLPGARELTEIIAVRLALEVPAAERAAVRATDADRSALHDEHSAMQAAVLAGDESAFMLHDQRLHGLLLDLAGNAHAARIIENLRDATRLVGASTIKKSRSLEDVYREHRPILDAIDDGDPVAAGSAMRRHLESTGRLLLREAPDGSGTSLWADLIEPVADERGG
ncbi:MULTISPECIES: GntR family transcriptional regulator [unclassified Arthrobacter]|uniref:GntR family transcriptional regulator n=1 Tax=unclassified Arthrobacter TaxID=235627 RepID=UPI0003105BFB|nr:MULTISPECIES: GntR family transcriptional regulator [unclassified Arthrobacter]PVE19558.1 GntR family transcriptional regulator [Arthrobacter sp. Bz4]